MAVTIEPTTDDATQVTPASSRRVGTVARRGVLSTGWAKGAGVVAAAGVLAVVVFASIADGSKTIDLATVLDASSASDRSPGTCGSPSPVRARRAWWSTGSAHSAGGGATPVKLALAGAAMAALLTSLTSARGLNTLALGDDVARSLGQRVQLARGVSALAMIVADIIGRIVVRPGELQAGIVTAFIGAPFFIFLVRSRRLGTSTRVHTRSVGVSVVLAAIAFGVFCWSLAVGDFPVPLTDVLVSDADTEESSEAFLSSPAAPTMPQVQSGAVAEIVGPELVAAVPPPTALSLTWGLDEYVGILAEAAAVAG